MNESLLIALSWPAKELSPNSRVHRNAERTQRRINEGRYTRGERIAGVGALRGRGA